MDHRPAIEEPVRHERVEDRLRRQRTLRAWWGDLQRVAKDLMVVRCSRPRYRPARVTAVQHQEQSLERREHGARQLEVVVAGMKMRPQPVLVIVVSTEVEVEPDECDRVPGWEVDLEAICENLDGPRRRFAQGHREVDDAAIRAHEVRVEIRLGGAAEVERPSGDRPAAWTTLRLASQGN